MSSPPTLRTLLRMGLLPMLVAGGASGVVPAAEQAATLEVRVIDAVSGLPIENAGVLIAFPELAAQMVGSTDTEGLYIGSGIEWDTARVRVTGAQYRYEWYDEGDDYASASPIDLEAGAVTSITVELDKGTGSITGVVRDKSTGLPVADVDVIIDDYTGFEHPDSDSGRFGVASARTDENGRYELKRLRGHDYVLWIGGDAEDHLYQHQFFGGAASPESATRVRAVVGEVTEADDVLLDYARCNGKVATIWRPIVGHWGDQKFAGTDDDDVIIQPDRRGFDGREPFYWQGVKYYAQAGNDTICANNADDIIYGGSGNDVIFAKGGNDRIYGGRGDDVIHGGSGPDYIFGKGGRDAIQGGSGDDIIYGGSEGDVLLGGAGTDAILGRKGNDRLRGGPGDGDELGGGPGDDRTRGGSGDNDWCKGGRGGEDRYWPSCELATGFP